MEEAKLPEVFTQFIDVRKVYLSLFPDAPEPIYSIEDLLRGLGLKDRPLGDLGISCYMATNLVRIVH